MSTAPQPASSAAAPPAPPAAGGNVRWTICGLLFFSVALNYIDRNIIGILKGPLSQELGWSETDYGWVASAFQLAYAFGYLFGGRAMDRFGVRRGLPVAVAIWSVAAAAHGLCSLLPASRTVTLSLAWIGLGATTVSLTAFGFMAARVVLGLAEGGNFPGAIKTVAEWFPIKERAMATGLFNAGSNVGAILCPFAVSRMYTSWGWPLTFYLTGGLGIFWLLAWWKFYASVDEHPRLTASERAYIRAGQPPEFGGDAAPSPHPDRGGGAAAPTVAASAKVPWLSLLGYRAVWAYIAMSVLAGPVWNIYMFFLPDFLQKRYQLQLVQVGDWTAVFYVLASLGGVAGGWVTSWMMGRGWTLNKARKIAMLCCAVAVMPIYFAPFMPSIWMTVLIVGLAGSAHQGWSANQFSFASDTMPREAVSSLVGLGGFISYFTGAVMTPFISIIVQRTGSYASIFAVASMMYVSALLLMHLLVPRIGEKKT